MPEEPRRIFTVAEANDALPTLERRLGRMGRLVRDLASRAPQGAGEKRRVGLEGGRPVPPIYLAGIQELARETRGLRDSGIIVRDLERGLVDFPSLLEGRPVFLCWSLGESQVSWFHEPDAGFAGRRPLPPDLR
jgi:hypothetical protein